MDRGCYWKINRNPPNFQKNPRAHKNKIGTPPPPPPQNPKIPPPPKREEFYGQGFFLQKECIFPGTHKIGAAISGPRIADKNFTDTRTFLRTFSPNLPRNIPGPSQFRDLGGSPFEGAHQERHATARFLEGFLEGSL